MAFLNALLAACATTGRGRTLRLLEAAAEEQRTGFRWYRDTDVPEEPPAALQTQAFTEKVISAVSSRFTLHPSRNRSSLRASSLLNAAPLRVNRGNTGVCACPAYGRRKRPRPT